ncbi:hypothetical protein HaLaN_02067 [Haematococcus lacustris]|uniref:Uncharacterized protein n=1 Tax=Haematococcus lacustris TaxID=44745 RepID=A0A699YD28_HAELA|nr:hypothetical protein HaLaN_02067 [Haematococcus lacustris]
MLLGMSISTNLFHHVSCAGLLACGGGLCCVLWRCWPAHRRHPGAHPWRYLCRHCLLLLRLLLAGLVPVEAAGDPEDCGTSRPCGLDWRHAVVLPVGCVHGVLLRGYAAQEHLPAGRVLHPDPNIHSAGGGKLQ